MKSCHQPCKNRTTRKQTDGMRRLPSVFFSGAGDTLRVSPGPLPQRENCHSDWILHIRPAQFLHSQNMRNYVQ
jgi:hypothetical protein